MKAALTLITALAYVAACLLYLHFFVTRKEAAERWGFGVLWVGFIAHTAGLVINYWNMGRFPVIDLRESLCFFSWSMAGMYLAVRTIRSAAPLGTFVLPVIAGVFIAAALLKKAALPPNDMFATILFPLHILLIFSGYAAFTLAFGSGIMYLLQERGLKSRRPGRVLDRLPSLSELDGLIYLSLGIGFPLLTLGIITGAAWLHNLEGVYIKWNPEINASMVTWLLYAVILHARLLAGWRGRKMAAASVLGFALILFTFLGAGLVSSGFHGFFNYP